MKDLFRETTSKKLFEVGVVFFVEIVPLSLSDPGFPFIMCIHVSPPACLMEIAADPGWEYRLSCEILMTRTNQHTENHCKMGKLRLREVRTLVPRGCSFCFCITRRKSSYELKNRPGSIMLTAIPSSVNSVLCFLGAIEPIAGWKEEEAVGVSVSQAIPSEGL